MIGNPEQWQSQIELLVVQNREIYNEIRKVRKASKADKGIKKYSDSTPLSIVNLAFTLGNIVVSLLSSDLFGIILSKLFKVDPQKLFKESKLKTIKEIVIWSVIICLSSYILYTCIQKYKQKSGTRNNESMITDESFMTGGLNESGESIIANPHNPEKECPPSTNLKCASCGGVFERSFRKRSQSCAGNFMNVIQ